MGDDLQGAAAVGAVFDIDIESDEELEQARAAGVPIVTFGGRVLRAGTGAITAAVLCNIGSAI